MIVRRISTVDCTAPYAFGMSAIVDVLNQYKKAGEVWLDPFAGFGSPAEITNDIDPAVRSTYHLDAVDFLRRMEGVYDGVIFDPPSTRHSIQNERVKDEFARLVKVGGYAFTHGRTSAGIGQERGFTPVEYVICYHGGVWSDTIITVDRKEQ